MHAIPRETIDALSAAIVDTLTDADGAGSDMETGSLSSDGVWLPVDGNLDVPHLSDVVAQAMGPILAAAWQEGRESVARDMVKPLPENGIRESSPNPYV
jgi:hypothetical protein